MLSIPVLTGAPAGGGLIELLLPIGLIFIVFYFLIIRPGQKQQKQKQAMLDALRRGDTVITNAGLIGKIAKVEDQELQIDLAEGIRVKMLRSAVFEVRSKTEPVKADKSEKADKDDKKADPPKKS